MSFLTLKRWCQYYCRISNDVARGCLEGDLLTINLAAGSQMELLPKVNVVFTPSKVGDLGVAARVFLWVSSWLD